PKITGIPLPKDEGEFFEDIPEDEIELPEESKLSPKDLQNRPDDPKPETLESEAERDSIQQKVNDSIQTGN
ncbi:MAG TPA: OstA-like protein, partial [Aequorivita sp.]|nr:OstA-like protein [Aequorivita sp.]